MNLFKKIRFCKKFSELYNFFPACKMPDESSSDFPKPSLSITLWEWLRRRPALTQGTLCVQEQRRRPLSNALSHVSSHLWWPGWKKKGKGKQVWGNECRLHSPFITFTWVRVLLGRSYLISHTFSDLFCLLFLSRISLALLSTKQ